MITLATFDHDFGLIRVQRNKRSGEVTFLQGGCYQSRCNILGISLVPYIHALFQLLLQAQSRNVLMIGCGGGSLATLLSTRDINVTIVDINPFSFDIARRHFGLPANVECCLADGLDFLAMSERRYDAIVMDAYCGAEIPAHLCDPAFFKLAKSCLRDGTGVFLANVHLLDDNDDTANKYHFAARQAWPVVRMLDAPEQVYRNAIILAGDVLKIRWPLMIDNSRESFASAPDELLRLRFV